MLPAIEMPHVSYKLCMATSWSCSSSGQPTPLISPREQNVSVSGKVAQLYTPSYRASRRDPRVTPLRPNSPTRTLAAGTSVTPPSASTRRTYPPVSIDREEVVSAKLYIIGSHECEERNHMLGSGG